MSEAFENFEDLIAIPIESLDVSPYYPRRDGKGQPTAVLLVGVPPKGLPEEIEKLRFVVRFRSRKGMENFIASLHKAAAKTWGPVS